VKIDPQIKRATEQPGGRLLYVDVMKAVGIVLVVAGHTISSSHRLLYSFHMPLFFFISGMTFKPKPYRAFLRSRAGTLLLPYVTYVGLVTAGLMVSGAVPWRPALASALFGGDHLVGWLAAAWFPTCLMLALAAYAALRLRFGVGSIAMIIAAVSALSLSYLVSGLSLPFAAASAPMAFVFLWLGENHKRWRAWLPIPLALLLSLAGALILRPYDMKHAFFGTPIASVITAFASCLCFAAASEFVVVRWPEAARWLSPLARGALGIMFLHALIWWPLRTVLPGPVCFLLALTGSLALTMLLRRVGPLSRRLLLGEK